MFSIQGIEQLSRNKQSWDDLFKKYEHCMNIETKKLFIAHIANPIKISDEIIKNIPIVENKEELIDIEEQNNPRIFMTMNGEKNNSNLIKFVRILGFKRGRLFFILGMFIVI